MVGHSHTYMRHAEVENSQQQVIITVAGESVFCDTASIKPASPFRPESYFNRLRALEQWCSACSLSRVLSHISWAQVPSGGMTKRIASQLTAGLGGTGREVWPIAFWQGTTNDHHNGAAWLGRNANGGWLMVPVRPEGSDCEVMGDTNICYVLTEWVDTVT
jgi:hypothetical protein